MANVKLGTKAVGSIVKIKVNGASKDFIVVQQGNPNTSTYDSSCNGTWLLMKDIYTTSTFGNNNSYKDSSIYYGCALPEDLEKEVGDILSAAQAQITAIINKLSA